VRSAATAGSAHSVTRLRGQPETGSLASRPIDFRPEFRRTFRLGFLVGSVLWIVGVLPAFLLRPWGDEAMPAVAVSLAVAIAAAVAVWWLLLNRRAFAAMRAVGVLNALSAVRIRDLVGDPAPPSADELARRLGARSDDDAVAVLAAWLGFEGRNAEATRILESWTPARPVAVATKARITASLALVNGDDADLTAAEAAAAALPEPDDRATAQALVMMVAGHAAAVRGADAVPYLARAAGFLGARARRGPLEVERKVRRITLVLVLVGLGPLVIVLAVIARGGG
jgi:hypothetical protein